MSSQPTLRVRSLIWSAQAPSLRCFISMCFVRPWRSTLHVSLQAGLWLSRKPELSPAKAPRETTSRTSSPVKAQCPTSCTTLSLLVTAPHMTGIRAASWSSLSGWHAAAMATEHEPAVGIIVPFSCLEPTATAATNALAIAFGEYPIFDTFSLRTSWSPFHTEMRTKKRALEASQCRAVLPASKGKLNLYCAEKIIQDQHMT